MSAPGDDLVARLKALSRCEHDDLSIGDEAADRIERDAATIAELRARIEKVERENVKLLRIVNGFNGDYE